MQGSRERPGRLLRLVPVRDQSAPQASYMHMHIHVHVACDLASAGPAVQAEGALCKAGRATGAEVSQLAVAEVVEDDRRVGATREVVLVHAARYLMRARTKVTLVPGTGSWLRLRLRLRVRLTVKLRVRP